MKKLILISILFLGSNINLIANSIMHFKIDCQKGNLQECLKLGHIYRDGTSGQINYTQAIKYYRMACENGYIDACNNLAMRYLNGQGVKANKAKAIELFSKSCTNGLKDGCHNLKGFKEYNIKINSNKSKNTAK